ISQAIDLFIQYNPSVVSQDMLTDGMARFCGAGIFRNCLHTSRSNVESSPMRMSRRTVPCCYRGLDENILIFIILGCTILFSFFAGLCIFLIASFVEWCSSVMKRARKVEPKKQDNKSAKSLDDVPPPYTVICDQPPSEKPPSYSSVFPINEEELKERK
ncbi:hypothetical protein PMAYCL1PPCAC_33122, partial [Pristionchus mayeri]